MDLSGNRRRQVQLVYRSQLPSPNMAVYRYCYPGKPASWRNHTGCYSGRVVWLIMQRTTWGYRLRMVGMNPKCTSYLGLNTEAILLSGMLLSGAIAGLAGASEIMGAQYRLRDAFLSNYGYDAIAVALLAQSNPVAILFLQHFRVFKKWIRNATKNGGFILFPGLYYSSYSYNLYCLCFRQRSAPVFHSAKGGKEKSHERTTNL